MTSNVNITADQSIPLLSRPASHGKRFVAFIIDIFVIGILSGLSSALFPEFGIVQHLVPITYMVYLQARYGYTLGKKMMGLFLVQVDLDDKVSWLRILARETIGRFLAIITIFGYVFIFFTSQRQGLHEIVFKTRVVTYDEEEQGSIIRSLIISITGATVALAGFIGIFLFSNIPIKQFAKSLEQRGIHIDGINGNLWSGFSVDRLRYESEKVNYEFKSVVLDYESLMYVFIKNEILIKEVSVESLNINLKKFNPLQDFYNSSKTSNVVSSEKRVEKSVRLNSKPLDFKIKLIDINKVTIQSNNIEVFSMNRLYLEDFSFAKGNLSIKKSWFDSKYIVLNLDDLMLSQDDKQKLVSLQGQLNLKSEHLAEYLAGDMDFQFELQGSLNSSDLKLKLVGLRKSVEVIFDKGQLSLQTNHLQAYWYLKNIPPLSYISVQIKGPPLGLFMFPKPVGSFQLRGRKFEYGVNSSLQVAAKHIQGDDTYLVSLKPNLNNLKIPLQVSMSGKDDNLETALSHLYFSRELTHLTSEELKIIETDKKYIQYSKIGAEPLERGLDAFQINPSKQMKSRVDFGNNSLRPYFQRRPASQNPNSK